MRRRSVVATAALIAALALAGMPGPAGSRSPSNAAVLEPAAFTSVVVPADAPTQSVTGSPEAVFRSAGFLDASVRLAEPGAAPTVPTNRPKVDQPTTPSGGAWKKPLSTVSGYATFYDNGTTAMRLPAGTVVRICGAGGCIERTVTDYGPAKSTRVVDMYRPDFFSVCGCASWTGSTWVTVSIY